jgi:hypothetical protein
MSQDPEPKRQYAVICLHCRQPIPIPQIMVELQRKETKRLREGKCQVFNLRCVKCGKEKPYKIAEILEVEAAAAGIPRVEPASSRPPQKSKAANG